jgi:outer membrane protein assembly factor BamD
MFFSSNPTSSHRMRVLMAPVLAAALVSGGCFRKHKYENPITKDTVQPDKILFDKAMGDIERGRYEVARLTLQTLMNTYDTSEYLAKAKLAYADSWFREGGTHGLANAEAEYKDFILFYPTMEEAAEAQEKVCKIHYNQMEKADRDLKHSLQAEDECRNVLVNFPNSKFAPQVKQLLRNIQEVIAEHEYRIGTYYHAKGSNPAAANRLQAVVDQYPLYSNADDALFQLADAYNKMGPRFRQQTIDSYSRIVKDYPLSGLVDATKKRLTQLEAPVPEPDPVAVNRMKYEIENKTNPGMMSHVWGVFKKSPDMYDAAKAGEPAMTSLRPTIPVSVPKPEAPGGTFQGDVTVSTVPEGGALDTKPDARANPPAPEGVKPAAGQQAPAGGAAASGQQASGSASAGAAAAQGTAQGQQQPGDQKGKKQKKPKLRKALEEQTKQEQKKRQEQQQQ